MRYAKLLFLPLPLILAGCFSSKKERPEAPIHVADASYSKDGHMRAMKDSLQDAQERLRSYQEEQALHQTRMDEARQAEQDLHGQLGKYRQKHAEYQARIEEAHQNQQAIQESLRTHAEEQARHQARVEEARATEQAIQDSMRTHAEELARRQAITVSSEAVTAPQPLEALTPVSVPAVPEAPSSSVLPAVGALAVPAAAIPAFIKPDSSWQPTEGHLARASDLVMELKKIHNGKDPTRQQKVSYLQYKMNLAPYQAEIILNELGV